MRERIFDQRRRIGTVLMIEKFDGFAGAHAMVRRN